MTSPQFTLDRSPDSASPAALGQWIERAAVSDMFGAIPPPKRNRLEPFVERSPGVIAYGSPALDSLLFNRVFVGGELGSVDPAGLAALLDRVAERGVRRRMLHVCDEARSPELLSVLESRGIARFRRAWIRLMREPGELPESRTELSVREATADDGAVFAEIAASCLGVAPETQPLIAALPGRPHWHVYVACDRGRPVATGALLVLANIGYLAFGATLPEYRGRGAQRALLDKRIRMAFALGCRRVFSETGEAVPGEANISYANMLRLGLRPVERRENYVPAGCTWR